jgi:dipeptidyl-peptidase 4
MKANGVPECRASGFLTFDAEEALGNLPTIEARRIILSARIAFGAQSSILTFMHASKQRAVLEYTPGREFRRRIWLVLSLALVTASSSAQDVLKTMRGYSRYQKTVAASTNAVKLGSVSVTWKDDGKAFEYPKEGKRYRFDIVTKSTTEVSKTTTNSATNQSASAESRRERRARSGAPERGRQYTSALSPDGKLKAVYRNRNVWLTTAKGSNELAVTIDGSDKTRVKYGSASWVYGEELYQSTAMWWSTNSQKLAFYRFDERNVPDFYLQLNQTKIQSTADIEPYSKAGSNNPMVELWIYDVPTKQTVRVDVRDGKPFDNSVVGHYVYGVSWTADGELLFHRTNRRQNIMELCAADAESGKCRVLVREEWPASWTENLPTMRFLKDGKRFVWASERTGWNNFYLYDLSGELLATLTKHPFEVADIARIDEKVGLLFYTARSGDNPMKLQLHRVRLDGTGDRRLTEL